MESSRNPDSMTPAERDTEIASILARGVLRAVRATRERSALEFGKNGESRKDRLELSPDVGLSVTARPAG